MKSRVFELPVKGWPYHLEICTSEDGILLRPKRRARAGWSTAFKRAAEKNDDLAEVRNLPTKFEAEEWEW
jgi:hypothetical protein